MDNQLPSDSYRLQLEKHQATLSLLLKKRNRFGWIRFFIFLITAFTAYYVFVNSGLWGIGVLVSGLALLLLFISFDVNNNSAIENTRTLIKINEEERKILMNNYHHRFDGAAYHQELHPYSGDLDLFGRASLFQWSNRCNTEQGRSKLAKNFLNRLTPSEALGRQEAVKEISPLLEWRQQLQSFAAQTEITKATESRTLLWLSDEEKHFTGKGWKIFVGIYSVITITSALAAIFGFIPPGIFSFMYAVFFSVSILLSRNTVKPYIILSGIVKEIATLHHLVKWIEEQSFRSPLLLQLQQSGKPENGTAAGEIKELKSILDRFDVRLNIAGLLIFSTFLLWDVRQMMALNDWRKKNRHLVEKWFEMIGEAEVLNSLACIHFNQPSWCFPLYSESHFTLETTQCGHPLIPQRVRVDNSFSIKGTGKIGLITGSNMAGKSTFLRSVGVNLVLAQMGSVVCASTFTCSQVQLMSSMRIADNLAENTSTFYAELKKLKTIIDAVKRKEKVFILLDEILRGTNSLDRHTGSEALIGQLIREQAVAIIATHDVELATLEDQYPSAVENYHFDVAVEGEELYFDYLLKGGVCKSLNASILMKKIGIELI